MSPLDSWLYQVLLTNKIQGCYDYKRNHKSGRTSYSWVFSIHRQL